MSSIRRPGVNGWRIRRRRLHRHLSGLSGPGAEQFDNGSV